MAEGVNENERNEGIDASPHRHRKRTIWARGSRISCVCSGNIPGNAKTSDDDADRDRGDDRTFSIGESNALLCSRIGEEAVMPHI